MKKKTGHYFHNGYDIVKTGYRWEVLKDGKSFGTFTTKKEGKLFAQENSNKRTLKLSDELRSQYMKRFNQ